MFSELTDEVGWAMYGLLVVIVIVRLVTVYFRVVLTVRCVLRRVVPGVYRRVVDAGLILEPVGFSGCVGAFVGESVGGVVSLPVGFSSGCVGFSSGFVGSSGGAPANTT